MAPAQGKPSTLTVTVGRDTGAPGISDILLASGSSIAAKFCSQPSSPQSRHNAGVRLHFLPLSPSSPCNRILGSFVTKLVHKLSPPSKKSELAESSQDSFLSDTLPSGVMGGFRGPDLKRSQCDGISWENGTWGLWVGLT